MEPRRLRDFLSSSLNRGLYGSKNIVPGIAQGLTYLASAGALGALIYGFGFEPDGEAFNSLVLMFDVFFGLFVGSYLIRLLYSFRRFQFLKINIFEGIISIIIIANAITNFFFGNIILKSVFEGLNQQDYAKFYFGFVSVLIITLVIFEIARGVADIRIPNIKPSVTFVSSFIALIGIGTGLLMLPACTIADGSMPFLEALFTATSASCVTGLIVVDTATYFTMKGQLIIMMLIQLGGIGIVTFATFFSSFLGQGVRLTQQLMLQDFLGSETLMTVTGTLRKIVLITFTIEFGTFLLLMATWEMEFSSIWQKVYYSGFHAISAFCNAGFSLFSNGLYEQPVRFSYVFHLVIVFSVILGSLGFSTIEDLFSPKELRSRLKSPWKDWKIPTKISVYVSAGLLIFGTILFFFLERGHTLSDKNLSEQLITSFFQSGITRTAGFNTVDIAQLQHATYILLLFLMFVGGSTGSVSGGIKTSTFYLIINSVVATLRGRLKIEIGKRYVPKELLFKALSIFFFAASLNVIGVFILSILEPDIDVLKLVFEQISAFGTVGLSTGITSSLSLGGKIVIIISMFVGRIGTLTFALALSTRISSKNYKYPRANLVIG